MAFARLSTQQAVDWLRQKTRTASTPADQNGEWSDQDILDALNAAVREITTRMLTTPWAPYFITIELNQTPTNGVLVVGASTSQQYSAIKVAYVQGGAGALAYADKCIRPMSFNRYITTVNTQNPDSLLTVGDKLFYTVVGSGHDSGTPVLAIRLFNNNGVQVPLTVTFYCYPASIVAASGSEFIGLPPIAWNAMLSYTLMLLSEDDRNMEMRGMAEGRFNQEFAALIIAAPTNFDMPDSLLNQTSRESA